MGPEPMDYEITPEDVKAKLDRGEAFTLLDVREPWEFEVAQDVYKRQAWIFLRCTKP